MPQTFAELIQKSARGAINDEASTELEKLVSEMTRIETTVGGKPKGSITVRLNITLDRGVFETQAEVTTKHPARVKPRAFLYATRDGGLSEEDTRQHALDFGADRATPKDVTMGSTSNVRSIDDKRMAQANDK